MIIICWTESSGEKIERKLFERVSEVYNSFSEVCRNCFITNDFNLRTDVKSCFGKNIKETGKNLENYSSKYDNFILLGDLNSETTESAVRDFSQVYGCKHLIKDNNSFKNPKKSSCIDLIITNRLKSFQNSVTLETGLSDFHKMTLTVI